MKKKLLKILIYVSIFSMLLTLCSGFASAVDPVSAATMANALAQAITAYGASQGVSMTFDVASTDGIGEGVHDLWNEFKDDIQDNNVPTYDSLALTMWADIYTKVGNNIGININDTEMPYIDAFWNWLLSGPAEMTKVDDQYYQWTLNQNNTVDPIPLISINETTLNGVNVGLLLPQESITFTFTDVSSSPTNYNRTITNIASRNIYFYWVRVPSSNNYGDGYSYNLIGFSDRSSARVRQEGSSTVNTYLNLQESAPNNLIYYNSLTVASFGALSNSTNAVPVFDAQNSNLPSDFYGSLNSDFSTEYQENTSNPVSVRPYIGDTVPQDIYIPDNNDVNYSPLPYIGGLDINWDDTLFGDGTGTLTDAQKEEITGTIDDDIAHSIEKTLTLAADDPEPAPPANEVYIPFLPLQLPSFNFSLSGIWHYVITWVGTLGSWFTAMFNMWSCLPYAMVVPVYATLVVVIVLGVYRRFLS